MKAQRRHELKANALAHGIEGFPELWRLYGGKVLLGLCAVLAIVLLIKFQRSSALQQQERAQASYASALADYQSLRGLAGLNDEKLAGEQRRQLQDAAEASIRSVLDDAKDDSLKADALVTRGDVNWTLATLPAAHSAAAASTKPTTSKSEDNRNDLLETARRAYEAALQTPKATPLAVVKARLGLGAIAEQRHEWDAARAQYDAMIKDSSTPDAFRSEAKLRIDDLPRIQKPVLIGKAATQPADSELKAGLPATRSSSQPTTKPTPAATSNVSKK